MCVDRKKEIDEVKEKEKEEITETENDGNIA